MSKLTTYRATSHWFASSSVTLQVDSDVLTAALATEINQFWSSADDRVNQESGDVTRAVVRMFGERAIRHFMEAGGACFDVKHGERRYWTQQVIAAQVEGWPDVSGLGIVITSVSVFAVGYQDVALEAV